jgi:hypothetical protein
MSKLLIVGSAAQKRIVYTRQPRDTDLIADLDTATEYLRGMECTSIYPIAGGKKLFGQRADREIFEIELAWPDSLAEQLLFRTYKDQNMFNKNIYWADLDTLYALKMSHRYLKNSPHFKKTMDDIRLLRQLGAKIPEDLRDWFKARERETYAYKLPSLNQSKDSFFQDKYRYDHDSLHEAVKFNEHPAYHYFAEPGAEVKCSKALWDLCPLKIKLQAGVEESTVLALERSLIPHPGAWTEDYAFEFALGKVCTSITSGWFREFCWENYDQIMCLYKARKDKPLAMLNMGLAFGVVKVANEDIPDNRG